MPLLEGSPLGVIYIVGPRNSPVGYIAISFGWSIETGGIDGSIDEIWIRPAVRDKGMASEALSALIPALREAGVTALHTGGRRGGQLAWRLQAPRVPREEQKVLMTADLRRPSRVRSLSGASVRPLTIRRTVLIFQGKETRHDPRDRLRQQLRPPARAASTRGMAPTPVARRS